MVCWETKLCVPVKKVRKITYRNYKDFDENKYQTELINEPFHVSQVFDSIDDTFWFYSKLLINVIDDLAPIKTKTVKYSPLTYMNGALRRAFNVKNMLKRRYERKKPKETTCISK